MTPSDAVDTLRLCGIPHGSDFHTLDTDTVLALLERANAWRYRKPKGANGSRARYFHAHLQRLANRKDA